MKLKSLIYKASNTALYISKDTAQIVPKYSCYRHIRLLALAAFVLCISACSDSSNAQLNSYGQRLENLSGQQRIITVTKTSPHQPRVAELRLSLPQVSISLLDSFRLSECRLGQLIAERNSSLGKVMTPANQLYYEIQVTRAIQECLSTAEQISVNLRTELEQALATKEAALPLAVHNFLTTDDIWRSNFRVAHSSLPMSTADDFTHTMAALNYFAHTLTIVVTNPYQPELNLNLWQEHLEALNRSRFLSAYWHTLATVPKELDSLTELLQRTTEHISCSHIARPQQAEYLHNVMLNIYIAQLQPVFARWVHYEQQLTPVLSQLLNLTRGNAWQDYMQQLGYAPTSALQHSSRLHAEQWQALLQKCRLSPAGNESN